MSVGKKVVFGPLIAFVGLSGSIAMAENSQPELQVEQILADIRAGKDVGATYRRRNYPTSTVSETYFSEASAYVANCDVAPSLVSHLSSDLPEVQRIAVDLNCSSGHRYGMIFSILNGDLTEVELWPRGLMHAPPPAPPRREVSN